MKISFNQNNYKKENVSNANNNRLVIPLISYNASLIHSKSINKDFLTQLVSFKGHKTTPEMQTEQYKNKGFIGYNDKLLDGTQIWEFKINSQHPKIKEIITELKEQTSLVNSNEKKIRIIQNYISKVFSKFKDKESLAITNQYYYHSMLVKQKFDLGDIVENGAGVCRHRSALFKLICDNVFDNDDRHRPRASITGGFKGEAHSWNVVKYIDDNGVPKSEIIDYDLSTPIDAYEDYEKQKEASKYKRQHKENQSFEKMYYTREKNFKNNKIEGKSFINESFNNQNFTNEKLNKTSFNKCTINDCDFSKISSFAANFDDSMLNNCSIKEASLINSSFLNTKMENIDFSNTSLWKNDFSTSSLKTCCFNGTNNQYVNFEHSTITDSSFINAKLGCNFSSARITNCDFAYSDLLDAHFKDTDISSSAFDYCKISKNIFESNQYFRGNYKYIDSKELSDAERNKYEIPNVSGIGMLEPINCKDC
ncbi:MAG: pentapeptide repeat-containing protein [bacterium]